MTDSSDGKIIAYYNCGAYGASTYSECETATSDETVVSGTSPTATNYTSSNGVAEEVVTEPTTTESAEADTPTSSSSRSTTYTTQQTDTPAEAGFFDQIAGMGWSIILPSALVVSVAIAAIIALLKRK